MDGISHVINFDPPEDRDGYVHRVGRTGRAGRTGVGITFVGAEQARDVKRIAAELRLDREFELSGLHSTSTHSSRPPRPQRQQRWRRVWRRQGREPQRQPQRPVASAQPMIEPGHYAPDFTLPDQDGEPVKLSELRGQTVVLYFYPKADTPGCTTQACGVRDHLPDYDAAGAVVLGVSPDPVKAVKKFHDKQG